MALSHLIEGEYRLSTHPNGRLLLFEVVVLAMIFFSLFGAGIPINFFSGNRIIQRIVVPPLFPPYYFTIQLYIVYIIFFVGFVI